MISLAARSPNKFHFHMEYGISYILLLLLSFTCSACTHRVDVKTICHQLKKTQIENFAKTVRYSISFACKSFG